MPRFLHIKTTYVSACYEWSICDPSQRKIFCFICGKMGTSGYVLDVDIYTCISCDVTHLPVLTFILILLRLTKGHFKILVGKINMFFLEKT